MAEAQTPTTGAEITEFEAEEGERLAALSDYSSEELLAELQTRFKWLYDMEHRFACVLDHATGGMMSKTNYTEEAMYCQIDEHLNRQVDEAVKEEQENA